MFRKPKDENKKGKIFPNVKPVSDTPATDKLLQATENSKFISTVQMHTPK
jgi:hypothetical protein